MGQACLQVGQRQEVSRGLGEDLQCSTGWVAGAGGERQSCERGMPGLLIESHCRIAQGKREEEDPRSGSSTLGSSRSGEQFSYLSCRMDLGRSEREGGEGVKFIMLNLMCLSEF